MNKNGNPCNIYIQTHINSTHSTQISTNVSWRSARQPSWLSDFAPIRRWVRNRKEKHVNVILKNPNLTACSPTYILERHIQSLKYIHTEPDKSKNVANVPTVSFVKTLSTFKHRKKSKKAKFGKITFCLLQLSFFHFKCQLSWSQFSFFRCQKCQPSVYRGPKWWEKIF